MTRIFHRAENGKVFCWGFNDKNALGHTSSAKECPTPQEVVELQGKRVRFNFISTIYCILFN